MIINELGNGIIQLTLDEKRWYFKDNKPYPSVTWILDEGFPKDIGFDIYLADKVHSWEQAKSILREAGDIGTRVHWGIQQYLLGKEIKIYDTPAGFYEPFSAKEWQMILDAKRWCDEIQPVIIGVEQTVFHDEPNYAGTEDLFCNIGGEEWIIDWKTSQAIYDSHKSQLAAYAQASNIKNYGIVRLGSRHKKGYEFWTNKDLGSDIYWELFKTAHTFWEFFNPEPAPKIIEVPESLNLKEGINENELANES